MSILLITIPGVLTSVAQQKSAAFSQLAEKAQEANDENHLEEAAALYTRALALRPRWTNGWWSLGTIEYDQNLYAKAATAFARLVALQPGNGTAHAMLGLCQFELQQDESALKNLLKAEKLNIIKNEELRTVALYHLGVLLLRARRFGDAKETLDQLAKVKIKTKESTTALGFAVLLISPKDAPPEGTPGATVIEQAGEAETLLMQKGFEQAKQIYTQLTADYPEYPNLHFAFGRLLLETNETDMAVQQFQLELRRDPENVNSLLEIAAARYLVDSEDGLNYAERALKLAPRLPLAHYLAGVLRLDTGNAAGAIPELEAARQSFPNEPRIYFSLGNAYARVDRKADAAKARVEFARLNAQEVNQRRSTLYSDRPLGLSEGQLQILGKGAPRP
ncbi:MAG TPA: tetratricopeptide repeat protein [Candidatus Acidoferrum sp.]|nr:tetratricopeptide repeat protein [Candidatus Acidoferrum sp.]